jgi:putative tryptophan/tyrosine transport system substrate-binding protein
LQLPLQEKRLPSAGVQAFAEAGGLIGYGLNFLEMDRRADHFVDKILKGVKPAGLPVEQRTKFELVINLKTGRRSASPSRSRSCCGRTR